MKKNGKNLLWTGLAIIVVLSGGFLLWNASQNTTTKTTPDPKLLTNSSSHTTAQGTRIYPVTLVEFGDYQCPACGVAEIYVEKILAEDAKVKLVFRNFPLTSIHKNALLAAEAAEAAGDQNKFWEMHNAIYVNQALWSDSDQAMDIFVNIAQKLNLDVAKFTADVKANKFADIIKKDQADGEALGVNHTPTFYINGKEYTGPNSFDALKAAVDLATSLPAGAEKTT